MAKVLTTLILLALIPLLCIFIALSASQSLHGTCLPSWAGILSIGLLALTTYTSVCCYLLLIAQGVDYIITRLQYGSIFHLLQEQQQQQQQQRQNPENFPLIEVVAQP
ncbi:E3 CR1-gamma [Squirrel monkey adenovirus]|nr:E3 CR1-gamma [Squirrel monkey adenovirus]